MHPLVPLSETPFHSYKKEFLKRENPKGKLDKIRKVLVAQLCLTLCNPMDCSPPDSSVHGILQARILEWVAIPFSRASSWPRLNLDILYFRQIVCHLSHQGILNEEQQPNFKGRKYLAEQKVSRSQKTKPYGALSKMEVQPDLCFWLTAAGMPGTKGEKRA